MVRRFGIAAVLVALLAVVGFGSTVKAEGLYLTSDKGDATIASGQTVDGSAYMAGARVAVDGTVKGDLFCAGETVIVRGVVEGDVLCAGRDVVVEGTVGGDIRAAGATVTVNGVVTGSVSLAGETVTLGKSGKIGRDLTAGAARLIIEGSVARDVAVGSDKVDVLGMIGRDVSGGLSDLQVAAGANIGGNLNYSSDKEGTVAEGTVKGNVGFNRVENERVRQGFDIMAALLGLAAMVVFTVLVVLLMPRLVHTAASLSFRNILLAGLLGLAFVVLVPVLIIALFATWVGFYAALALIPAYILVLMTSVAFVSYYVGALVLKKRSTNAVAVGAVGAAVLGVLYLVPILNVLLVVATILVGAGMQVVHLKYQFSKKPYKIVS